jgi:hypothetical protein
MVDQGSTSEGNGTGFERKEAEKQCPFNTVPFREGQWYVAEKFWNERVTLERIQYFRLLGYAFARVSPPGLLYGKIDHLPPPPLPNSTRDLCVGLSLYLGGRGLKNFAQGMKHDRFFLWQLVGYPFIPYCLNQDRCQIWS